MEHLLGITVAAISGGGQFISKVFGRMRALEDRIDHAFEVCIETRLYT